jgi:hypothetical protein
METVTMIKKVVWIRIVTLTIIPFITLISLFLFSLIVANLDQMTPDNYIYEVKDNTPLQIEVSNRFTNTNERYRTSITNKEDNSFTVVYSLNNVSVCTFDVLIDGGNVYIEYSNDNPYRGTLNHDGTTPIQFQFSQPLCNLGEFGIYVERQIQLSDMMPAFIVALVIFVLILIVNLKVRKKFIDTLDINQFRAIKLETSQKVIFVLIGFFSPLISLILFLILGTDTKNYKNIKSTELSFLTSLITVLLSLISIIMIEFIK